MKTKDKPQAKQYVIYSRKSKFTGKGESIENQIELCRQYIAMHFGEEAAENVLVYEDEGFSGGNLERPQFKKMMKDSQKITFAAIVVYRLDRISRNIGDFAKLIEDLGDRHIDFISIREQFDTSSPMGRAMMYIASVFSQLERETIAERIRDNMHELSKTGRWLGGTTPTGYASESLSSVTVDGKVKKACKLGPIPEEIQLVKTIFEGFMETGSLSKTDQYLLEHRCVTKRGKQFTRFAIRGILTNPVYMIADETAYQYLKENHVDLFAERSEFDGEHGIMAYNRTLQRSARRTRFAPWRNGSWRWGSTPASSRAAIGCGCRPCWMSTNPRAIADPAATWRCCPGLTARWTALPAPNLPWSRATPTRWLWRPAALPRAAPLRSAATVRCARPTPATCRAVSTLPPDALPC